MTDKEQNQEVFVIVNYTNGRYAIYKENQSDYTYTKVRSISREEAFKLSYPCRPFCLIESQIVK